MNHQTTDSKEEHPLRAVAALTRAVQRMAGIRMPPQPPPPVESIATIAIMSMPMIEVAFDGFHIPDSLCAAAGGVNSFYVRWLEAAGIRVVVLQWNDEWETKLKLLQCINGVLFPGGDLDHFQDVLQEYFVRVKEIYQYAVTRMEQHGDPFFLWGTCQGFQLLCAAAADDLSVVEPGFEGTGCCMMALELTEDTDSSTFLGSGTTPAHILEALRSSRSTLNVHRYGVSPSAFSAPGSKLGEAFRVLATNVDSNGRPFVSCVEHKTAAIVAVQFHPEWPPFDYSDRRVEQSTEAIAVSSYISQFIRSMLRRNATQHFFRSTKDLEGLVVERCPVTYEGFGWELYWNKPTKRT
jgi:gamma-glutamyl hydrolase